MFGKVITYLKEHFRITLLISIIVLGIIVVALGYTYAIFTTHVERQGAFTLIVPELKYTVTSSFLNEQNQITVEAGQKRTLEISVTNTDEVESHFKLYYLGSDNDSVIVSYQENDVYPNGLGTLSSKGTIIFTVTIENNSSAEVTITLGAQGGLVNKELNLNQGKELVEKADPSYQDGSGANRPVLVQGQIPVTYDTSQASWVKADTTKKWYDYDNQEWANAVTVTEANRETYMNAEVGTPISMDDINTMWVWIPRYEYMYTNLGTNYAGGTKTQPGEIKVNFLNRTTTTPSDSTDYKVHPAFTFGSDELEGFWYAKFEVGGTLSSPCANESCDTSKVIIKPSVTSLRNQTVSSFFYMARSMQTNNENTFGFSKTDSDLHMSKNSEWGAVAYLAQSKYGKYGNSNYHANEKEVRNNNCSSYTTGVGADYQDQGSSSSTCTSFTYQTVNGQKASTTGNITGVYDMSGGAWEHIMGNFNHIISGSGFATLPDEKYYDTYLSSNPSSDAGSMSASACNGGVCFGHALSETRTWYNDYDYFITSTYSWIQRGAYHAYTSENGIFAFNRGGGGAGVYFSTRLTHVPLN